MKRLGQMVLGATMAAILGGTALADSFPTRAITLIVPYGAGGGGDTVARIVADRLSGELGVTINVVNRPGAGGEIGISEIAAAVPDGYTLGVFGYPDNFVIEATRDVDFNSDEDLLFLARFDNMPMGIFARPGAPFSTIEELQAHASENPGEVVIGESGALGLLSALALSGNLDVVLTDVRYGGGGDLLNALLGQHIDLASTSSMSHDAIVDAGGTALAFAGSERMAMFPDVPTLRELGIDQVMEVGRVLVAPSGIPDEVRDRLAEALEAISTDAEMIARFENASLPFSFLDHDGVTAQIEASNAVLGGVISDNLDRF
ncbi:MAG: tripartite tricarboxylate transporter substrate binding protein [Roseinatronobacter sp.]